MKETVLKKEFKEADIQRLRNLVTGRYGEKTKTQIGYQGEDTKRNEGDIWEENDKFWTIEDGIKVSVPKLDEIRKISQLPLKCPSCNSAFNDNELNKKMYIIHKMCADCVFKMESKLKIEGKFKEYKENMMNNNKNSLLDEFDDIIDEYVEKFNTSFYTEDGDMETWVGGSIDTEHIKKLKEYIKIQKTEKI
jgi:hypothetical protein